MANAATPRRALATPGKSGPARQHLTLRLLAALPGGYALSALGGICLSLWLPLSRADCAMAGILVGLLVWPVTFMACFGVANGRKAFGVTLLATLLTGGLALLEGWRP